MSRARDREKHLSPRQKLNLWPSVHRSDALTTELRRARDELDYIQGFCALCLWHVFLITSFLIFSLSFKFTSFIYHTHDDCILPSSPRVFPSSVVRASELCQKGHKFNSCRGLRFFLVLVLLACIDHVMSFLSIFLVGGVLSCYHSNETSSAVLSHGTIYLVYSPNFWNCGWNLIVLPFKLNLFSSSFTWHYYLVCSPNFWNLGWNPMLLPFNETYGAIYFLGFHKRHVWFFVVVFHFGSCKEQKL